MSARKWIFGLGHGLIPIALIVYMPYFGFQYSLVLIAFLSLLWTAVLIWISIKHDSLSDKPAVWIYMAVDLSLLGLIILLPQWRDLEDPFRLAQSLLILYAVKYEIRITAIFGLIMLFLMNVYQFHTDHARFSFDFIVNMAMTVVIVGFVGLTTNQWFSMAYYDALTHLPNRRYFKEKLVQTIRQSKRSNKRFALMFLDLNRFKAINDTLGHEAGDQLLRTIAERLRTLVDKRCTIARLGGDELTVLMPIRGAELEVRQLASAIAAQVAKPVRINDVPLQISVSIGIAFYPEHGSDVLTLMKRADAAMYIAKEESSDYEVYTPVMQDSRTERLTLESELGGAIERGELTLHYQPKVDVASGETIGAEALLRWHHPQKGLIAPDAFIPIAEESGLIVPIGAWVLLTACEQNRKWMDQGFKPIVIAVNVSAKQFRHRQLLFTVSEVLQKTGMDPSLLELEITENVAIQHSELVMETLHKLKQMGVQISIDDFGAGYSSLSYLSKYPVHTLKIDRSFIRECQTNKDDEAIVDIIIRLAKKLQLQVIAEGVEVNEQLDVLKRLNCDQAQGYLFQRPVGAAEMGHFLQNANIAKAYVM